MNLMSETLPNPSVPTDAEINYAKHHARRYANTYVGKGKMDAWTALYNVEFNRLMHKIMQEKEK